MLTVKHIATDGTETILEAERVEMVQTGDNFADGIFLDRAPAEPDQPLGGDTTISAGQTVAPPRSFKHVFHFDRSGCSGSLRRDPMVYVMNRYGATVATYRL